MKRLFAAENLFMITGDTNLFKKIEIRRWQAKRSENFPYFYELGFCREFLCQSDKENYGNNALPENY